MTNSKNSRRLSTKARSVIKQIQKLGASKIAQQQAILDWFKHVKPTLTTCEARAQLSIMHPGGRILELRRKGCRIELEWITVSDLNGVCHRVGKYCYLTQKER